MPGVENSPKTRAAHPPGLPPAPTKVQAAAASPLTPSKDLKTSPPQTVSGRHTPSVSRGGLSTAASPTHPTLPAAPSSQPFVTRSNSAGNTQVSLPRAFPCVAQSGRHRYTCIPGAGVFSIPERYTITRVLGQGSFGTVVAAYDSMAREHVAIKKCAGLLAEPEQAKRVLRSVKLMRLFNHPNILGIRDLFLGEGEAGCTFDAVYIVMEQLRTDLYKLICERKISSDHTKYFIYQIIRGVYYIHSAGVLHRDLKPDNVLTNAECEAKICDFDFARGMADSTQTSTQPLSDHVQTRMYRAPEVLLGNPHYTGAVDVWSVGCILAEMLRSTVLFPGKTQLQMMHLITEVVDIDPESDFAWVAGRGAQEYVRSRALTRKLEAEKLGRTVSEDSKERLRDLLPPGTSDDCIDFLQGTLAFDPASRLTAQQLLEHKYLADWHRPATETKCNQMWRWKWDSREPPEALLYQLWWKEINFFARHAPAGPIPHVMSPSEHCGVSPSLRRTKSIHNDDLDHNKENCCNTNATLSPASPAPPPYSPPAKMPSPPKFSPPSSPPTNISLTTSAVVTPPVAAVRIKNPTKSASPLQVVKRQPLQQISPHKPPLPGTAAPLPSNVVEYKPLEVKGL